MKPKDASQIGAWTFRIKDLEGNEITIPPAGHFHDVHALWNAVLQYIRTYDEATGGQYSLKQREFAQDQKIDFDEFILNAILHQMCINNQGVIPCWADGIGDQIHIMAGKLDTFIATKLPDTAKKVLQKTIQAITPSHVPQFSACQTCGGTTSFDPNVNNAGRAGTLNNLTRNSTI